MSLCFLTLSVVFPKTELFINLKKFFSKPFLAIFLGSVFILIYGSSQAFWLNLITLWTFFKTNPWFNVLVKMITWTSYSFLSCKLAFLLFQVPFFLLKMANHLKFRVSFLDIVHQENIPHQFLHYSFSSLNWENSSIRPKLSTGRFWDTAYPCKLFTSQTKIWWFFIFIIIFHIFVISFFTPMNCMTYSTSNSFFSH